MSPKQATLVVVSALLWMALGAVFICGRLAPISEPSVGKVDPAVQAQAQAQALAQAQAQAQVSARAWGSLTAERRACANPQRKEACQAIEQFIESHPTAREGTEARALLAQAKPWLDLIGEAEDWRHLRPAINACKNPRTSADCDSIKGYLTLWPRGAHAPEARSLLERSQPRLAQLAHEQERRFDSQRPPPAAPASPAPARGGGGRVQCCDGTSSPTCTYDRPSLRGCCSHHGGVC